MASFNGLAEVVSILPHIPVPVSKGLKNAFAAHDASHTLRTLRSLYAAPEAHDGGSERAQKRRKLDNGNASITSPVLFEEEKSIVLSKVSLELVSSRATLDRFLS